MTALAQSPRRTLNARRTLTALLATAGLAIVVGLTLFVAPAGIAHAEEGDVTWSVRTASNQFGADRTGYNYALLPGGVIEDALVVVNNGDAPVDLGIYAADGYTTDSGQFDLLVAGAKSVGIGAWVAGTADSVSVAPGESKEFPFSLTVPANATPGDYSGGIVTSLTQADDAKGINVDRRLGIKINLRVGGDLTPSLAIENMSVVWGGGLNPFAGGEATLTYTLHNTGNAVLATQQATSVTGPFGWLATDTGTMDAPPQLLPGERWAVSVPVGDVPASFLLFASATVVPIVIDASGSTTDLETVTASATGLALPWMLLLAMLVLAALVVLALGQRRRRLAQAKDREDARVTEAVELALEQVL
jgi:hypothetical protein